MYAQDKCTILLSRDLNDITKSKFAIDYLNSTLLDDVDAALEFFLLGVCVVFQCVPPEDKPAVLPMLHLVPSLTQHALSVEKVFKAYRTSHISGESVPS